MSYIKKALLYYRKQKSMAFFGIFMSILWDNFELFLFFSIGQIVQILYGENGHPVFLTLLYWFQMPPTQVNQIVCLLCVLFLTEVVAAILHQWVSWWIHWNVALRARKEHSKTVIEKILTLPLRFYENHNPGRIINILSRGLENHMFTYPEVSGGILPKIVRIFVIFTFIAFINVGIAVFGLLTFLGLLYYCVKSLNRVIRQENLMDKHYETTQSQISELITNIKTVKSFGNDYVEFERQKRRVEKSFHYIIYRINKAYCVVGTWRKTVNKICLFMVTAYSIYLTLNKEMTVGSFVTLLPLFNFAFNEIEPICFFVEQFSRRFASIIKFHKFLDIPVALESEVLKQAPQVLNLRGEIEFKGVSFNYASPKDENTLRNINLHIRPNETIGLVGRSGSGKTSLIKLLLRYFDPANGEILIDGKDLKSFSITDYRKSIAIVHQEVDLFNRTLLENLTYHTPNIPLEEVKRICKMARIDDLVDQLPKGLNTVLGDRGSRLSGGQKQRVGIARALLAYPKILIFDEATSSLDYESERRIQEALKDIYGTCTTLIVAHRLSTLRDVDRIVVLEKGEIANAGPHSELLKTSLLYKTFYELSV